MRTLLLIPFALALSLLGGWPAASLVQAEEPSLDTPLEADPAIAVRRTLKNGFTYWVRPHMIPGGVVELGLHVRVGSLDEQENERGLAHFLEHMAFNGSTHFPPGEVVKFFESQGLTFGQHQNANTGYDRTKYFLSLPTNKPAAIEKGLTFFADIAYGLTLSAKEIDAERPVILEELRARSGAQERIQRQQMQALAPKARVAQRSPIGLESVIREAGPETFRALYERGYRPERTTLLICGDVDPKTVEPMVQKLFGSWKVKGEPLPQPAAGLNTDGALRTRVLTDPEAQGAQVVLLRGGAARPDRTVGDIRKSLTEICALLGAILRWQALTQQSSDFEALGVDTEDITSTEGLTIAVIAGDAAHWKNLTKVLLREIRRIHKDGFSPDELTRVKHILLAQITRMIELGKTWNAKKQLEEMFDSVHSRDVPISGPAGLALVKRLLPGITKAEIEAEFRAGWALDSGLLAMRVPAGLAGGPTEEALARVVKEALATAVTTSTSEATSAAADLGAKPTPGVKVASHDLKPWAAHSVLFENGVLARHRQMRTPGHVIVRISLLAGIISETAADRGLMEAAALALSGGSMASRTNSSARISQAMLGTQAEISAGLEADRIVITIEGSPSAIEPALHLVHHVLRAPKVEGPALKRWKAATLRGLDSITTDVSTQAVLRSQALLSGGDLRLAPISRARLAAITVEAAQARIDAAVRTAPLQVTIVGDVEAAQAESWASLWLASLPKRPTLLPALQAKRAVSAGPLPQNVTLAVDTITDKAVVRLAWRGAGRADSAARATLHQAAMILTARLNLEVREKRGLTYTAGAGYFEGWTEGGDALVVMFTADPAKAAEAAKLAKTILTDLRTKGPTAEEVTTTQKKVDHLLMRLNSSPAFWASFLGSIEANGRTVRQAAAWVAGLGKVDGARIEALLKQFATDARLAEVIATPKTK